MFSVSDGRVTVLYQEGIPPNTYSCGMAEGDKYVLVWRVSAMVDALWLDAVIVERAVCHLAKEIDSKGARRDEYEPRVFICKEKESEAIRYTINWYDGKCD